MSVFALIDYASRLAAVAVRGAEASGTFYRELKLVLYGVELKDGAIAKNHQRAEILVHPGHKTAGPAAEGIVVSVHIKYSEHGKKGRFRCKLRTAPKEAVATAPPPPPAGSAAQ